MAYIFDEPSRTFNEYLLVPGYSSAECTPDSVSLATPLVKFKKGEEPSIKLSIPMVSAIMQAVSDDGMAVALAQEGGLSFIYGSQSVESQAAMVRSVKDHKAGFVRSDSNLPLDATLADVVALKEKSGHTTMPVTEGGRPQGKLLGIVTGRDYRLSRMDLSTPVAEFMTPVEKLITAPADTSLKVANDIIWDNKLNSLPIVDNAGNLLYMVFRKDYESHKSNPHELLDDHKRYLVGAGITTRDYAERVPALVEKGIGRGQATALIDVAKARDEYFRETGIYIPVCSDGGIVYDYHMTLALAMGADFLMLGRYFARFDESPTNKVNVNGNYMKEYWGEGSSRARNWQRYDLGGSKKGMSFEEGVDSYVPYAGSLKDNVGLTLSKVKSTMCNCGALTISELQEKAKLTVVSATSIVEGGAHDVLLKDKTPYVSNTIR